MDDILEEDLVIAVNKKIRECTQELKISLDTDDLTHALKHSTELADQLRLCISSPKSYYDIYVQITDELRKLEAYLTDEFTRGNRVEDLYEVVQYNQFVLPRLYMMITVAVVYLKSNVLPHCELLRDLSEMCKGVQDPLRGLFLRNYLLQAVKKSLPSCQHKASCDVPLELTDPIDFILGNFCEMNKLWVRMQYQGHSKEQISREAERKELRLLIGTNILQLSQLEGMTVESYTQKVLPFLCKQMISCKDKLAQSYIFECVVQAFPDAFHIQAFEKLMSTLMALDTGVSFDGLMGTLTERLSAFSHSKDDGAASLFKQQNMVARCIEHAENIIKNGPCVPRDEVVGLYKFVLRMALQANIDSQEKLDTANKVSTALEKYLMDANCSCVDTLSTPLGSQLLMFLHLFLDEPTTELDFLELLRLNGFEQLTFRLDTRGRTKVAVAVLQALNDRMTFLRDLTDIQLVLRLAQPLLDNPYLTAGNEQINISDQQLLGSFAHRIYLSEQSSHAEVETYNWLLQKFQCGGNRQLVHRLPTLVFAIYEAVKRRQIDKQESFYDRMLMEVSYTAITMLIGDYVEAALNLLIHGALVAAGLDFKRAESCAYEFITQAFALFEDSIVESCKQMKALTLIYGAVHRMHCFSAEDGTAINLRKRLVQASMLLIKRPDQCRMLVLSSILYWGVKDKDCDSMLYDQHNALGCLVKARQVVSKCIDNFTQCQLLLDIVDQYFFFLQRFNEKQIPTDVTRTLDDLFKTISKFVQMVKEQDNATNSLKYRANYLVHMAAQNTWIQGDLDGLVF